MLILLILSIISNYLLNRNGITVGEDACGQVLSSIQFLKGETHLPNYTSFPDCDDLSINNITWSPRPPGGSWIAVPGLLIGLTLGKAINFMLVVLYIIGSSGLLLLARKLKLPYDSEILYAVFLGLSAGEASGLFFSMNCALFSVIPFLILFSLKYKDFLLGNNSILKIIVFSIFLGLCLGSLAFIKLSGMIAAYSITAIPIIYILIVCILKRKIRKRNILGVSLLIVFTTFPFKTIEFINESIRGKSANLMYSSVDYNSQYDLWGNYFEETTQGKMLFLSALGGPGYSTQINRFAELVKNLVKQFPSAVSFFNHKYINLNIFIYGVIGLIVTFLLLLNFADIYKFISTDLRVVFIIFSTLPFIGLAVVSYLHGFNYVLYSSHTIEYSYILLLPLFSSLFTKEVKFKLTKVFLFGFCIAIPITNRIGDSISYQFQKNQHYLSSFNHLSSLKPSIFSKAIEKIEEDSTNPLDIILFLPRGDLSDLYLRTNLRCYGMHFAQNNIDKIHNFNTSKNLNIYCAYNTELGGYEDFINVLKSKTSKLTKSEIIHNDEVTVLKFSLSPNING